MNAKRIPFFRLTALRIPAVLVLLSLLLSLLPIPPIIGATLLVAALSFVFPLYNVGFITRAVLSILFIASLNNITGLIFWILKISVGNYLLLACYNLILLAVLWRFSGFVANGISRQKKFLGIELVGLILAAVAMGVTLKPLAQGADAVALTRILTFTDDNTAHVTIVKHIENHGGYLYGNQTLIDSGTPRGHMAYPQGWHLNTRLAIGLFSRSTASPDRQLLLYYSVATAWVGALAYVFTVSTLLFARSMRSKIHTGAATAGAIGVGSALFVGTIYPLFTWGAHPQIASFVLLLAILPVFGAALSAPPKLKTVLTTTALIYIAGIAYVYYFELPIALLFALVFIFVHFRQKIIRFWENPQVVAFALLLILSLVPVVMYFKYIEVSQAEVLQSAGGTLAFGNNLLLAFFLICALYSLQKKSGQVLWVGILLLSSATFMAVIMLYQYRTLGSLHYYAFKASHTVILISALIFAILFTEVLSYLFSKKESVLPLPVITAAMILAAASLSLTQRHPLFDIYVIGNPYGMNKDLASEVVAASKTPEAPRTLAIGSCQSYFDVRAMNMIIALSGKTTPEQTEIALAQYNSKQRLKVFDLIRDYQASAPTKPLTIISSDATTKKLLQDHLGSSADNMNFIDIISGDPNVECPLRLS